MSEHVCVYICDERGEKLPGRRGDEESEGTGM